MSLVRNGAAAGTLIVAFYRRDFLLPPWLMGTLWHRETFHRDAKPPLPFVETTGTDSACLGIPNMFC